MRIALGLIVLTLLLAVGRGLARVAGDPQSGSKKAETRIDQYGDSLPHGAFLRIGTLRWRPGVAPRSMAFTRDSKRLVTAGVGVQIQVWSVATGKELSAFGGIAYRKWSELISPDAQLATIRDLDGVCIHEVATGKLLNRIQRSGNYEHTLCFSPDATLIAMAGGENDLRVFDTATGKLGRAQQ